jgi:hypothetical protein
MSSCSLLNRPKDCEPKSPKRRSLSLLFRLSFLFFQPFPPLPADPLPNVGSAVPQFDRARFPLLKTRNRLPVHRSQISQVQHDSSALVLGTDDGFYFRNVFSSQFTANSKDRFTLYGPGDPEHRTPRQTLANNCSALRKRNCRSNRKWLKRPVFASIELSNFRQLAIL